MPIPESQDPIKNRFIQAHCDVCKETDTELGSLSDFVLHGEIAIFCDKCASPENNPVKCFQQKIKKGDYRTPKTFKLNLDNIGVWLKPLTPLERKSWLLFVFTQTIQEDTPPKDFVNEQKQERQGVQEYIRMGVKHFSSLPKAEKTEVLKQAITIIV